VTWCREDGYDLRVPYKADDSLTITCQNILFSYIYQKESEGCLEYGISNMQYFQNVAYSGRICILLDTNIMFWTLSIVLSLCKNLSWTQSIELVTVSGDRD
jgi:hypothetical protein